MKIDGAATTDSLVLDLSGVLGWVPFRIGARDKAGNFVTAEDSVKILERVELRDLQLRDREGKFPIESARPGFTNSSTVKGRLTVAGFARKIELSESPDFTVSLQTLSRPFQVEGATDSDTTLGFTFQFSEGQGTKTLYARAFGPQLTDTSEVVVAQISVDKEAPGLDSVIVYHSLEAGDTTFFYTNARTVRVRSISTAGDLDRILLWEAGQDSVFYPAFSPDTAYSLKSPDDGAIPFFTVVGDSAGNLSNVNQTVVYLDRRLPQIDLLEPVHSKIGEFQAEIRLDAHDDTLFSGVGALDFVEFSESESFAGEGVQRFGLPGGKVFSGKFEVHLNPVYGTHEIYARIRDRAGNWSSVRTTTIEVVPIVQPVQLTLQDITPASDSLNSAFSGWSNSDTVSASVLFRGELKKILLSTDSTFSRDVQEYDSWQTISDSVGQVTFMLGNRTGMVKVFCKLLGPTLEDTSRVISSSIRIDKTPPKIAKFELFQVYAEGDTSFLYTNAPTVDLQIFGPSWDASHVLVWETPSLKKFFPFQPQFRYTFDSASDGTKMVYLTVRDSAGNWSSAVYSDSIRLDTTPPTLEHVILSDISVPGDADSILTDELVLELSFSASDLPPGELAKLKVAQSSDMTANLQTFRFGTGMISEKNGRYVVIYSASKDWIENNLIACWVAVEDSARNSSKIRSDTIVLSEVLRIHVRLVDPNDPADSLFSAGNEVTVQIAPVSGFYEEVSVSENPSQFAKWRAVQLNEALQIPHVFENTAAFFVGKIYVAARNSIGQMAVDSASITVDRLPPAVKQVAVFAKNPPGNSQITYERDVQVQVSVEDQGAIQTVQISPDSLFEQAATIDLTGKILSEFTGSADVTLPDQNGVRKVYVRAVDYAGNASEIQSASILADYDPLGKITNHPNPF
ncbi:MAG TPA: hypothetical protein ENJ23_01460, partial [Bacteroidetes bacterium]|nr:hypothetical protein [Bacteroidota bacterium]